MLFSRLPPNISGVTKHIRSLLNQQSIEPSICLTPTKEGPLMQVQIVDYEEVCSNAWIVLVDAAVGSNCSVIAAILSYRVRITRVVTR